MLVNGSCSTSARRQVPDLAIGPRPEIQGDNLGRPFAHPLGQIFPRDDQVGTVLVLAAQHDVGVGVARVEVIDRHPIECGV